MFKEFAKIILATVVLPIVVHLAQQAAAAWMEESVRQPEEKRIGDY